MPHVRQYKKPSIKKKCKQNRKFSDAFSVNINKSKNPLLLLDLYNFTTVYLFTKISFQTSGHALAPSTLIIIDNLRFGPIL